LRPSERISRRTWVGPSAISGAPFLQRDEATGLCRGHVINQALRNSSRAWTVQRADVDSFFGRLFEADFVLLQEKGRHQLEDVLGNAALDRKFRPQVKLNGRDVPFYRPGPHVPDEHTEVFMEGQTGKLVRLALKLSPSEVLSAKASSWHVGFERDLRLPALVSLLKAAHLTMFAMLGYQWALSAAGHFVGSEILGKFYLENRDESRPTILENAFAHFRGFANLVRPINSDLGDLRGTVSDHHLYLCTGSSGPWAFMVVVRTGATFHGVMLPVFEDAEPAARFLRFIEKSPERVQARLAKFSADRWELATEEQTLYWPESNFER
jgi:hypothetical protein